MWLRLLPMTLREISWRVGELVHQALIAFRLLDGIEVGALDVLEDRIRARSVVDLDDDHRHLVQAGLLRRAPAALAGDDLVFVRTCRDRPHHDRLDDAAILDRLGQLLQIRIVERLSRVARVRAQELHRHRARHEALALDGAHLVPDLADQGGQSTSQTRLTFFCHCLSQIILGSRRRARSRWMTSEASRR